MAETTITNLPNATTPLTGTERVPMDQGGTTVDATTQDIADLADPSAAIAAAVAAHEGGADPHPNYLTLAEGQAAFDALGAAAAAQAAAEAASDPAGSASAAQSAAEATAVAALNAHEAAPDPHPTYLTLAEGQAAFDALGAAAAAQAAAEAAAPSPGGSNTQVQFNDAGSFGGSADLTWDDILKVLGVGGDIDLDDGGAYVTTMQVVTPTANRTLSLPDATGTVALVAGSSGQLVYNSAGANAGVSGSVVGATGDITLSLNGAASTPPLKLTGTWFSGGTATTTKPQLLIEPSGTTSTAWSTSGTGLGVNAASGFAGNLLDLQVNGASQFAVTNNGVVEGLYFINKDVTGVQYFYGANLYARMSVGLASGTQVGWTSSATLPNAARDTGLKRDQAGVVAITDGSTGPGYLKQAPVAVSALPAAATVGAGTRGFVSDSTVAASGNFGATVTGGGSNNVPVFSDGTNWLIG